MTELYLYNEKISSVFELLGRKEDDISFSVGWAFGNCREFLTRFLQYLNVNSEFHLDRIKIRLQRYEEKGRTDFEIIQEGDFHIIIEAKRGWSFPSRKQLEKYVARPSFKKSKAKDKRIVVLNESIPAFTQAHFSVTKISSVSVQVISWADIQRLAIISKKIGRDSENRLLRDVNFYLNKIITMQKIDSNRVYVVSLANGNPPGWNISWKDIVNLFGKYFHPVGGGKGGWPVEPPNYIAFRYDGKLQSIHHIDKYDVFTDPSTYFPKVPKENWVHHYLYHLGPAILPSHETKTGVRITRNMRVWAMLDLLLTSKTIEQARDRTKLREQQSISH